MNKKDTIFDFITHVLVVWGITVLILCLLCFLCGEDVKGYSSMFELGSAGLPVTTLLQFLLLAFVITSLRWLFLTDKWIEEMSMPIRSAFMFGGVIVFVAIEAAVFGWFPINDMKSWVMFAISFGISAVLSVGVSTLKEKKENQKMQKALERLKGEEF